LQFGGHCSRHVVLLIVELVSAPWVSGSPSSITVSCDGFPP
jgi:hypothetical protein